MKLISMFDVEKIYNKGKKNEFMALKGVSLDVEKGDMIAIKGSSGAGKSSLLHIIGLLDEATSGSYFFNGKEAASLSLSDKAHIRNKQIGFVLQDFGLIEQQTVMDSVMMPLIFSEKKEVNIRRRVREALETVGLDGYQDKLVRELSGGEKQRVAIARALINSPELILADEPTGSLDEENAMLVIQKLKDLNQRGITVIIVTHDSEIADMCDKKYIMRYGKLTIEIDKNKSEDIM